MRPSLVESVRQRYGFRCGYCGVRETDAGSRLTIDHFQPVAQGGTDDESNLVQCCHACNEFKSDYWREDVEERILHPLNDDLTQHIRQKADGRLSGITPTGRFHIERLHLNREQLILQRLRRQSATERQIEQERLLSVLRRIEAEVQGLIQEVSAWQPEE